MHEHANGFVGLLLAISLHGLLAVIGFYDIYVLLGSHEELRTVSSYVIAWSKAFPLLPFAAGVLAGHLWFPAW